MQPIVSLAGRTLVVTGAGQGIGQAIAACNGATLQAAMAPLPRDRVLSVVGSVVDADLAARTMADAVARFGAVHGLVNNAGLTPPSRRTRRRRAQPRAGTAVMVCWRPACIAPQQESEDSMTRPFDLVIGDITIKDGRIARAAHS